MSRPLTHNDRVTPLGAVMAVTILGSFSTGIIWNGLAFIVKHDYDFAEFQTLWLYIIVSIIYVIGALMAHQLGVRVERALAPRIVLGCILFLQACLCVVPLFFSIHNDALAINIWIVAGSINLLSAFLWPIIESYLSAGRHGRSMRHAIGWWNIAWTSAVAAALLAMAPLVERGYARFAIVGLCAVNLLAIVALYWFPRKPAEHDEVVRSREVSPEYPYLLRSVRILLPVSYLLIAALSPLMPYLLDEKLSVPATWQTPLTAVWMCSRVVAVAIMWRIGFWHGKWGTLLISGMVLAGGFALVILATNVGIMILGLAVFGAAQGVVYYAALYYAMAVGRAQVDAGGMHEALIGTGYIAGPAITLVAIAIHSGLHIKLSEEWLITAMIWGCVTLAVIPAILPYIRARRLRQMSSDSEAAH